MSLLGFVFQPVRSLLSASALNAFEPDVRHNPTIVSINKQSDDDDTFQKEKLQGFAPQYVVYIRRPKTSQEAQRLYNHIRTISWYLDAIPILGRKLPFNIGVESIVGVIPGVGDYIGFVLSFYALFLCALFGLPLGILATMLMKILVDTVIGLVPFVGDALDIAFKANLRNLRLLEDYLISTKGQCNAGQFQLVFPPSNVFLPTDSPQRQQLMPEVSASQRQGWSSTTASSSRSMPSRRQQDFHNGTMKKVVREEITSTSTTIVPNEVFTTMRYEQQGITLKDMCSALPILSLQIHGQEMVAKKEQLPLLDRHLARLQSSIQAMKQEYPLDWSQCSPLVKQQDLQKAIEDAVSSVSHGACGPSRRVRVSVDKVGLIKVDTFDLKRNNNDTINRTVRLDSQPIDKQMTAELLYKHKTSHREMYDSARLRINANLRISTLTSTNTRQSPCFDVLMFQEVAGHHNKYITESSIANILFYSHITGKVSTPSVSHLYLLNGLFRQELLERGLIMEEELSIDRVLSDSNNQRASLYLCNALRGIIPVNLIL